MLSLILHALAGLAMVGVFFRATSRTRTTTAGSTS